MMLDVKPPQFISIFQKSPESVFLVSFIFNVHESHLITAFLTVTFNCDESEKKKNIK